MSALRWVGTRLVGLGLISALLSAPALAQDSIFADGLELPFGIPASDAEAVRFLNQAAFGATASDISAVRNSGVSGYLSTQFALPATLARPWMEAFTVSLPSGGQNSTSRDDRIHRWYNTAVTAPDQLRQRVAYALSQIIVVSDQEIQEVTPMAEWNDILVRNAFGNYRDLLREATLSPMMGRYLTSLRNRKFELVPQGNPPTFYTAGNNGVQPDENYSREIMQLFSIGLARRNLDFSLMDGDPGTPGIQPINTYDEETISTLARIFTGLTYDCSGPTVVAGVTIARECRPGSTGPLCVGNVCRFTNAGTLYFSTPGQETRLPGANFDRGLRHPDSYRPMVCYPRYHDNGRDASNNGGVLPDPDSPPPLSQPLPPGSPSPNRVLLVNGAPPLVITPSVINGTTPLNCHRTGNPSPLTTQEMDACVAYCDNNVLAAVDLLFNHPNTPSLVARTLIQRMVTSNPTPAYIERVAQSFVDNGSGVRGDMKAVVRALLSDIEARRPLNHPEQPVNFGKVREPLLRLVQLWRSLGAVSGDTAVLPAGNPMAGQPSRRRWGPNNPQDTFAQRPLGSPTVFNFYQPDYQQPGAITNADLYSPELQIVHEVSAIATANELMARICSGYGSGNSNNCSGAFNLPTDRAYFPPAVVDSWPTTDTNDPVALTQLVEFYNTRLLNGSMSGTMNPANSCVQGVGSGTKGTLYFLLRCPGGLNTITGGTALDRDRRRKLYILHLVAISPEFSMLR